MEKNKILVCPTEYYVNISNIKYANIKNHKKRFLILVVSCHKSP